MHHNPNHPQPHPTPPLPLGTIDSAIMSVMNFFTADPGIEAADDYMDEWVNDYQRWKAMYGEQYKQATGMVRAEEGGGGLMGVLLVWLGCGLGVWFGCGDGVCGYRAGCVLYIMHTVCIL